MSALGRLAAIDPARAATIRAMGDEEVTELVEQIIATLEQGNKMARGFAARLRRSMETDEDAGREFLALVAGGAS